LHTMNGDCPAANSIRNTTLRLAHPESVSGYRESTGGQQRGVS
jgi:hypothetical protein